MKTIFFRMIISISQHKSFRTKIRIEKSENFSPIIMAIYPVLRLVTQCILNFIVYIKHYGKEKNLQLMRWNKKMLCL